MLVSTVRIRNYKSILDTGWVELEKDITTLLGRNESGKTSFLQAIASFSDDNAYDEDELCYHTSHSVDDAVPIVSIKFRLEKSDLEDDSKNFNLLDGNIDVDKEITFTKFSNGDKKLESHNFQAQIEQEESIENSIAALDSRHQEILDEIQSSASSLSQQYAGNFRNYVNNQLNRQIEQAQSADLETIDELRDTSQSTLSKIRDIPEQNDEISEFKTKQTEIFNVYMEELSEVEEKQEKIQQYRNKKSDLFSNLPSIVYYDVVDVIDDKIGADAINAREHETFRNLLDIVGVDPDKIEQMSSVERIQRLDKAQGEIQGKVNELWDQKSVAVTIDYSENDFIVLIKDEMLLKRDNELGNGIKNTTVNRDLIRPSGRSKGFQWFFSFYINLNAATQEMPDENTLILLDDPAVYLHPKGKKNWLTAIEDISSDNQIAYSSHSPFLIKKEYPSRIRIVEDEKDTGTQVSRDFYETDAMTLQPLRNALGIGLGDSPFVSKRKILVEGITDYYILTGLANYFREYLDQDILNWEEVTVMPTNGGNNMIRAAKWVSSEEFSYALLLDNDQKGKEIEREIMNQHHEIDPDRVFLLSKNDDRKDYQIEIEDLFSPEFYIDCLNTAYGSKFDDFSGLDITQSDDSWEICGMEYKDRKLTSKINQVFENRDRGELDKILVSNEIRDRLNSGRNVQESDVEQFREILGCLRNVT